MTDEDIQFNNILDDCEFKRIIRDLNDETVVKCDHSDNRKGVDIFGHRIRNICCKKNCPIFSKGGNK